MRGFLKDESLGVYGFIGFLVVMVILLVYCSVGVAASASVHRECRSLGYSSGAASLTFNRGCVALDEHGGRVSAHIGDARKNPRSKTNATLD